MDIKFRFYEQGDEEGIVRVMRECFKTYREWGLTANEWLKLAKIDEGFDKSNALVAEHDGKIVGHVQIITRELRICNTYVKTGGIANVSTDPNYRGKGIATNLLKIAINKIKEMGLSLSSLFTDYTSNAHRIYRRLGFTDTLLLSRFHGKREEAIETIRKLEKYGKAKCEEASGNDLNVIKNLYHTYTSSTNITGAIKRSSDYIKNKILNGYFHTSFYDLGVKIYKVLQGDEPIGYFIIALGRDFQRYKPVSLETAIIFELAGKDNISTSIVLREALNKALERDAREITLPIQPTLEIRRSLKSFKILYEGGIYMNRIINLKKLFEEIKPSLDLNLDRLPNLNCKFKIETSTDQVNLEIINNEILIVEEPQQIDVSIKVKDEDLVQLIYGIKKPEDLILDSIKVSGNIPILKNVLKTLFRKSTLHIFTPDHW